MPDYPYSDNMYSGGLDDSDAEDFNNDDELYDVATGLGLGDSSYRPGGPTQQAQQQHHQHQQQQQQQQPYEDGALSPSDGYFSRAEPESGRSATTAYPSDHFNPDHSQSHDRNQVALHTSSRTSVPTSSQVPHVPNVWVSDPSLEQGSSDKAKEAQEDRDQQYQSRTAADPTRHGQTGGAYSPISPTTGASTIHYSPFSLLNPQPSATAGRSTAASPTPSSSAAARYYTPSNNASSSSSATRARRSATAYSERSSLFSEAPPAYTPSPTSPTSNSNSSFNNYQTFSPTSSTPAGRMGRPAESESHGLMAGQTYQSIPQSMGGELQANDDGHYEYPRPPVGWRERVKQFDWRKHWKLLLLGVVLTFVTLGFLMSSLLGIKNERAIKYPGDSRPVTSPGEKLPVADDDGTRLAYPPYDDDKFADYSPSQCGEKQLQYNRVVFELDYSSSRNLSVFQDIKNENNQPGKDIHIQGDIVIRRSGAGTPSPSIVLETASNHDAIQYTVDWDDAEQRLYMLTPRSMPWPQPNTSPCLSIRATIWAPPNSALNSLNIETVHLGISLLDNLSIQLAEFARLATTIGPIVSATDGEKDTTQLMRGVPPASFAFDSRYVEVKTMSADISGAWPLYDYLGLETISGSIHAGVTPKPALKEKPLPAVLYAHSTSGTIEVFEPIDAASFTWATQAVAPEGLSTATSAEAIVPPRQYGVDLYSMSGAVKARLAFGYSCKVHTTSGHVDLTLLPVMDNAAQAAVNSGNGAGPSSFLETSTTSGTTVINVLEPLWGDLESGTYVNNLESAPAAIPVQGGKIGARDPYELIDRADATTTTTPAQPTAATAVATRRPALRALNGRHTATSAALRVTYPASWEGWIDEDSMTGKLSVAGEGVQIVRQEEDFPGIKKHILAHKGTNQGTTGSLKLHTTSGSIGAVIGR